MNREESEKKIATALEKVTALRLDRHVVKSKRLVFHMHDEEFDEISATAAALDLSVADYFCALHRYAVRRLDVSGADSNWVHRVPRHRGKERDE